MTDDVITLNVTCEDILWQMLPCCQAVCVTRFNQSECVIFGVDFVLEKSSFERYTS